LIPAPSRRRRSLFACGFFLREERRHRFMQGAKILKGVPGRPLPTIRTRPKGRVSARRASCAKPHLFLIQPALRTDVNSAPRSDPDAPGLDPRHAAPPGLPTSTRRPGPPTMPANRAGAASLDRACPGGADALRGARAAAVLRRGTAWPAAPLPGEVEAGSDQRCRRLRGIDRRRRPSGGLRSGARPALLECSSQLPRERQAWGRGGQGASANSGVAP